MMNTLLCKAKLESSKHWIIGYYFQKKDRVYPAEHYIMGCTLTGNGLGSSPRKIDVSTLCRSTGAHDKNGRLIFENDILDGKPYNVVSYGNGMNEFLGMNVGWYVQRDNFESWSELYNPEEYEVTGNIFD